jgi:cellulose synthase/poly-beta-1,6-N-acetylglucosamine synthase-like glycosyltransferase
VSSKQPDDDLPFVSVVVPAYNAERHLPRCLESLQNLNWPEERLEIIVVDNNSTDDTALIASCFNNICLLKEKRQGATHARNAGWTWARGEWIAFTDADCEVAPDWLRQLLPAFTDPKVGLTGGELKPDEPTTSVERYIIEKDILSQERALEDVPCSPPFLVTANAAYRRRALEEVGGFDPWLTVNGEDADLAWRVQEAGWQLRYIPDARVTHHHRADLRAMLRQIHSYGCGTSYLFKKYRPKWGYSRFTLKEPYIELIRSTLKVPLAYLTGGDELERKRPLYDMLGAAAYLWGKLKTSAKLKVWNV